MQTKAAASVGLSGNAHKIIAALAMLIDHIGMILLPQLGVLRIIGRLAFPIFAFLICEGCRFTKNKIKYLGLILSIGIGTSVVYKIATGEVYLNVLITFSCSIMLIYLLKLTIGCESTVQKLGAVAAFALLVSLFYIGTLIVPVDYGFWGIMLPVFPYAIELIIPRKDGLLLFQPRFLGFALGLFTLCFLTGGRQMYALASLIPLAMYNGKRGFAIPKYSFYIFYPLHIALLWVIEMCIG